MPQDWKQEYLQKEREREAQRQAKLARLDLDIKPRSAPPPNRMPPQKTTSARPPLRQMTRRPTPQRTRSPQAVQRSAQGPVRTPVREVPFPQPVPPRVPADERGFETIPVRSGSRRKKSSAGKYIARGAAVFFTAILLVVYAVFALCFVIARGPSEAARNLAVQSALQASATKWVPGLFLDQETIDAIQAAEDAVIQDVVSMDDYITEEEPTGTDTAADPWAGAIDGMLYETVSGSTYKAYVLLVKDPARVFVGTSSENYANATAGINIFKAAEKYGAVAGINAGEFADAGGVGTGYAPIGLTYSRGECVWNDGAKRTFIGFNRENQLIVRESMTKAEADALGIRDAVSFQTGNTLIEKDGENVVLYYAEGNTGTAQRTAIGQRADGTVILICTDGRTASSLGATHNDMIDMMVSYGAVSAGMLDGGSSSMMYYRDYYNKYETDTSRLDKYQLQGLVNKYKAFTTPRRMPTFFLVSEES